MAQKRPGNKKLQMQRYYDASAAIYDRRYLRIQFQKLIHLGWETDQLEFPLLDVGTGTGLVWDFLRITQCFQNMPNPRKELLYPWIEAQTDQVLRSDTDLESETTKTELTNDSNLILSESIAGPFIGIDISVGMLQQLKQKFQRFGEIHGHILCADGEHLPFRELTFPSFIALSTLQNLETPELGFREIRRVACIGSWIKVGFLKKKASETEFMELMRILGADIREIHSEEKGQKIELEDWLAIGKIG